MSFEHTSFIVAISIVKFNVALRIWYGGEIHANIYIYRYRSKKK